MTYNINYPKAIGGMTSIEEFFNQAPRPKNFEVDGEAIREFVLRTHDKKIVLITVSSPVRAI